MNCLTMAAVALAVATPSVVRASEPDWEMLPGLDGAVLVEIDPGSVGWREGHLTLWLRISFPAPVASRQLPFRSVVAEHAVDCESLRLATMRMTTYSGTLGDGDVIDRWDRGPRDWTWRAARDDPADVAIIALAC